MFEQKVSPLHMDGITAGTLCTETSMLTCNDVKFELFIIKYTIIWNV